MSACCGGTVHTTGCKLHPRRDTSPRLSGVLYAPGSIIQDFFFFTKPRLVECVPPSSTGEEGGQKLSSLGLFSPFLYFFEGLASMKSFVCDKSLQKKKKIGVGERLLSVV